MITEQELREKLRKITALFERATTAGERNAAAAAMARVQASLASTGATQRPFERPMPEFKPVNVEMKFTFSDQWQRRLFAALCRRYGLRPYRRRGQRHTTVLVESTESFVDRTLWPEFLQLSDALAEYLNDATERIIRDEVFRDAGEAAERA